MNYVIQGHLCAYLCEDCREDLSNVTVRLYQPDGDASDRVVSDPKETLQVLDEKAANAKAKRLIAEASTNQQGDFVFKLNSDRQKYNGEAVEVDVLVKSVPNQKKQKKKHDPVQFTITVWQPKWRERDNDLVAAWDYCLPARFWCGIRSLFDAWVICGYVTDCETQQPLSGIEVTAFDADWLKDDELGTAVTDGSGHFRIDYTSLDFKQTFLSPIINVETPFPPFNNGPDVYFKLQTSGGIVLLEETRSDGKKSGRENIGNCFCISLCVPEPPPPYENPYFFQIGDFNIGSDINPTTGLTLLAKAGHGGPNYGFHRSMKLKGYCPKNPPSNPSQDMYYRFLFIDPDNPGTRIPIAKSYVTQVVVGARVVPWDLFGTGISDTYQDIIIQGSGTPSVPDSLPTPPTVPPGTSYGPVPPHILIPDDFGWVRVDQRAVDGGFYGPLVRFNSAVAVPGGNAVDAGDKAGTTPASPKNGKLITIIFQTSTVPHATSGNPSPADAASSLFNEQVLQAKTLVNNWQEVRLIDLQQFISGSAGGCTPIQNQADILYTADHELLASWQLGISTAASVTIPSPLPGEAEPSGANPRGENGTYTLDDSTSPTKFKDWPSCSYTVSLTTRRRLTDGETDDGANTSSKTFCK